MEVVYVMYKNFAILFLKKLISLLLHSGVTDFSKINICLAKVIFCEIRWSEWCHSF